MALRLSAEEVRKAGGKLPKSISKEIHSSTGDEANRIAMKLVGILAEASSNAVRRRALDKARRMLSKR